MPASPYVPQGGPAKDLHKELREKVCKMFCYGAYAVPLTVEGNQLVRPDQEKCSADGGREKKGKKKQRRDKPSSGQ